MKYVYFPTTAIVSLLGVMESGSSAEIAVVGNEGVVGVSFFMGGDSTSSRGVVQSAGTGYRLAAQLMKNEIQQSGAGAALVTSLHGGRVLFVQKVAVSLLHRGIDDLVAGSG